MSAPVISFLSQKGGVGKTVGAVNVAAVLAADGTRVLVVDLDPQGNTTTYLGLHPEETSPTIHEVLVKDLSIEKAIYPTTWENLELVPANIDLAGTETELGGDFTRYFKLRNVLATLSGYDMIVLDCPPSLGFLPINALLASSDLVIPLNPEEFGLKAIKDISKTVAKCKDNLGHTVRLLGVLITRMRAQTTLHQTYADEIRRSFGPKVFETSIREAVVVGESVTHRRPLTDYAPRHVVTEEFCAVTEELLRRVQASKTTGARRRLRAG